MKKLLFLPVALLALSAISLSSCKDDKDNEGAGTTPPPVVTPPKTSDAALALANAVYGPLQRLSSSYSFLLESATETAISFEYGDGDAGPLVSFFDITPNNGYVKKIYTRLYESIGNANIAIESIGASEVNANLDQEGKDLLIARSKFIRGYNYFTLVQIYGEVPLILAQSEAGKTTRSSIDEVYTQIVKDLTEAVDKLPEYESEKSKPSQAAANTVLAKAYLTWGQKPLSQSEVEVIKSDKADPAKPEVDADKLQKAVEYANKVIANGNYQLITFNNIWGVANENNDEVIFSIAHQGDGIDAQGNHQTHCGFTAPGDPRELPHISYADVSFENKLPANDARKAYSYVTTVTYTNGSVDQLGWPNSVVRPGKWIHRDVNGNALLASNQLNTIDHIDFRYAEVLLIKAEASFYLSGGGLVEVNELRGRAGVTALTSLTEATLQTEWQNEFAFEQKHWLNLVRWRTLITSVQSVAGYEYFKEDYKTKAAIEAKFGTSINANTDFYVLAYEHLHGKVDRVSGKFYRFPIPFETQSLGVAQNPGY